MSFFSKLMSPLRYWKSSEDLRYPTSITVHWYDLMICDVFHHGWYWKVWLTHSLTDSRTHSPWSPISRVDFVIQKINILIDTIPANGLKVTEHSRHYKCLWRCQDEDKSAGVFLQGKSSCLEVINLEPKRRKSLQMDHPPLKPLTWDMIQGNVVIICQLLIINVVMLVVLTWGTDMWWLGESSAWRKLLFILSPGIRRTWLTYKKEERGMHVLLFWIVMETRSVYHWVRQN